MNSETAALVFESLSSPVRLAIYRLLVKAGPSGLVAGHIASEQGLAANNASFHLKALTQAGLIAAEAEGRFLRYRAKVGVMVELIAYLTDDCCAGHPELCGAVALTPDCTPTSCNPSDGMLK